MPRQFNTTGPSVPGQHYLLDPLSRIDLPELEHLIAQGQYFVLHAPRQTGKTTILLALMRHLNQQGHVHALYANIEGAQTARHDVAAGIGAVAQVLARRADIHLGDGRWYGWLKEAAGHNPHDVLSHLLTRWARETDGPVVLMLDEVDALVGDTLVSLLRQLREGYDLRPASYPLSVILCGVRDVRDYRIHTSQEGIITGGSCFNIKAASIRLGNFSPDEIHALWQQHTDDSGQVFAPEIFKALWEDTYGQPWLVNALGHGCVWEDKTARDRATPISLERYYAARERLIQSRATHLDQLADKLREERVRRVIAPLLLGEELGGSAPLDDLQYVEDLGLIRSCPQLEIANRIYAEVIPRDLTWTTQTSIPQQLMWYLRPDGSLDMPKLLAAFQQFFRENSEIWLERFDYKEAGPHLLMQAFLQRI
ncbi:MAG: ATP-binding protein, partial [Candidatus Methylumidiphilus sp.]